MRNELVIKNSTGKDVTTSLIVAEVFGKRHDHVLRDIENLNCSQNFRLPNFGATSYTDASNRQSKMYEITKDGFSFLVMGYTGEKAGEFKERFIAAFNANEALLKDDDYIIERAMSIMSQKVKALQHDLENKTQVIGLQQKELKQQAPKVAYHDAVLNSESTIITNVVAKELGMSAVALNKLLHSLGIIYENGGVWVLYAKYEDKGYAKMRTHYYTNSNGELMTKKYLVWTELGVKFIHEQVKNTLKEVVKKPV